MSLHQIREILVLGLSRYFWNRFRIVINSEMVCFDGMVTHYGLEFWSVLTVNHYSLSLEEYVTPSLEPPRRTFLLLKNISLTLSRTDYFKGKVLFNMGPFPVRQSLWNCTLVNLFYINQFHIKNVLKFQKNTTRADITAARYQRLVPLASRPTQKL